MDQLTIDNTTNLERPGSLSAEQESRLYQPVSSVTIEQEQSELRNAKIMIIDDESLVVRVVRRFLSADGYKNFVTISDPREAFESIDREQPDVVLLDIMMPHITGLDLLKVRHRSPVFQHIPFIILSANSENQIKREALQLGATDFLSKPVDPSDLTLRVRNALMVKRHHDHLANYAVELEKQSVNEPNRLRNRENRSFIVSLGQRSIATTRPANT